MRDMQAVQPQLIKRLNLRETRSSRSFLSIASAIVVFVAVVWLGVEQVLSFKGDPALLVAPAELASRTASLATDTIPGALAAAGTVAALLGLALLVAAFLPGTKPRHIIENDRSAVVVDSEVLAAAVSRTARTAARLAPEQVASSVSRKRVDVRIRPGAGRSVDTNAIREAVEREMAGYGLRKPLAITFSTGSQGAVGA
ncbi:hypothetical protein SAMN04489740_2760 [Arthrobacter alpinus]|jgi:hypothetical protein|uniref:DNA/RNA endonuclease G n=1 Tax=Arthrobacter alpinus TaxID=656366 RepID=A0A1H5M5M3_9MICC|nr:DUF6286 domain-containing protein [Arthrobacter alpinus]SEE84535.1 hypothetical protein SAMN04489740_2760 [Arthrobacter alpinus]